MTKLYEQGRVSVVLSSAASVSNLRVMFIEMSATEDLNALKFQTMRGVVEEENQMYNQVAALPINDADNKIFTGMFKEVQKKICLIAMTLTIFSR